MKISGKTVGDIGKLIEKPGDLKEVVKGQKDVNKKAGIAVGAEALKISENAKEVRRLARIAGNLPTEGEKRIGKIKAAIEKGTYNVESRKVAGRMIEEAVLSAVSARRR